jgi:hypothetical protein
VVAAGRHQAEALVADQVPLEERGDVAEADLALLALGQPVLSSK